MYDHDFIARLGEAARLLPDVGHRCRPTRSLHRQKRGNLTFGYDIYPTNLTLGYDIYPTYGITDPAETDEVHRRKREDFEIRRPAGYTGGGNFLGAKDSILSEKTLFGGARFDLGFLNISQEADKVWKSIPKQQVQAAAINCMHLLDFSRNSLGLDDSEKINRMRSCLTPYTSTRTRRSTIDELVTQATGKTAAQHFKEALQVIDKVLSSTKGARHTRSRGSGPRDAVNRQVDRQSFNRYVKAAGCSPTNPRACRVSEKELDRRAGCDLVQRIRIDVQNIIGGTPDKRRLSLMSCDECLTIRSCSTASMYTTNCVGGRNKLLLFTDGAARQRLSGNFDRIEFGMGCSERAPAAGGRRGRREVNNDHDSIFAEFFSEAERNMHWMQADTGKESCLARCGGETGPCLACGLGRECRRDTFSLLPDDYQCLEISAKDEGTLEDILFRQKVTVVTKALKEITPTDEGKMTAALKHVGAWCNEHWTPVTAAQAVLTANILAAAEGVGDRQRWTESNKNDVKELFSPGEALNFVNRPIPSETELLQWRGDSGLEEVIEDTAEAAANIVPRLQMFMLAAKAHKLRQMNWTDEQIAEQLPPRTILQPDFLRAGKVVDDLSNDNRTVCTYKQLAILSFALAETQGTDFGEGCTNNKSQCRGAQHAPEHMFCHRFQTDNDAGASLNMHTGHILCIDHVTGNISSYANYTAEIVRDKLLTNSAKAMHLTRNLNRRSADAQGEIITCVTGPMGDNECTMIGSQVGRWATSLTTRRRRSYNDVIGFRNYCRWASSWVTRLLALDLPCLLHDAIHGAIDGNPETLVSVDTRTNSPGIKDLQSEPPVVTQVFGIPIPVFTAQLRLTIDALAGYLAPSDTDCSVLGRHDPEACHIHHLRRCGWMFLHIAGRSLFDVFADIAPFVCRTAANRWFLGKLTTGAPWRDKCADAAAPGLTPRLQEGSTNIRWPQKERRLIQAKPCNSANCFHYNFTNPGEFLEAAGEVCRGLVHLDWKATVLKLNPTWKYGTTLLPEKLNLTNPKVLEELGRALKSNHYNGQGVPQAGANEIWHGEAFYSRTADVSNDAAPVRTGKALAGLLATYWVGLYLGAFTGAISALTANGNRLKASIYGPIETAATYQFCLGTAVAAQAIVGFITKVKRAYTWRWNYVTEHCRKRGSFQNVPLTLFNRKRRYLCKSQVWLLMSVIAATPLFPETEATPPYNPAVCNQSICEPRAAELTLEPLSWEMYEENLPGTPRTRREAPSGIPENVKVEEIGKAVIYHAKTGTTAAQHRYHNLHYVIDQQPIWEGIGALDGAVKHQWNIDHPNESMPAAQQWSHDKEIPRSTVQILLRHDKVQKLNNTYHGFLNNVVKTTQQHLNDALDRAPGTKQYYPFERKRRRTNPPEPVPINELMAGKDKRSIFVAVALSLVTTIGSVVMSLFNANQVSTVQNNLINLSHAVGEGFSAAAKMSGTIESLAHGIKVFQKVYSRRNSQYDFTDLFDATFNEIDKAVSNTMEIVASAASQTLHPLVLMQLDGPKIALELAKLRQSRGLVPIITTTAELVHLETTLGVVVGEDGRLERLQVATSIPMVAEKSQLALFRHVRAPLRLGDGSYVQLFPGSEKTVAVAMRAEEQKDRVWATLSSSDLSACRNVRRHFICPSVGALRPPLEDEHVLHGEDAETCAYALYSGLTALALSTCERARVSEETVVAKIGPFSYAVYVEKSSVVHVRCNNDVPHTKGQSFRINRMAQVEIPPGCEVTVNGYRMSSEDVMFGSRSKTFYSIMIDGDVTSLVREQIVATNNHWRRQAEEDNSNSTASFFDSIQKQAHTNRVAAERVAVDARQDAEHMQTRTTAISGVAVAILTVAIAVPCLVWLMCRIKTDRLERRKLRGGYGAGNRGVNDLQTEVDDNDAKFTQEITRIKELMDKIRARQNEIIQTIADYRDKLDCKVALKWNEMSAREQRESINAGQKSAKAPRMDGPMGLIELPPRYSKNQDGAAGFSPFAPQPPKQ